MAIALDNNLVATIVSTSTNTVSYTTTGSNLYLVVGTLIQGSFTCTGVTYNGVAMTQLTSVDASVVSGGETNYLFGLANPASGAHNIVASFSGATTNAVLATSYTGAQQTTAVEASNTSASSGTISVTTSTNNDWLVGFARAGGNTTAGSNTTIRGAASNISMMDTNAAQTPAGAYSLNFTGTGGNVSQAIALKPFSATTNSTFLSFM